MDDSYSISRYLNIRLANQPRYFSDGRHIAFLTNITGIPQAWRVKVHEKGEDAHWPEQLTFEAERVQWLTCSPVPGDDRVVFGRDVGGNENAQIFMLDGPEEVCLTEGHGGAMHLPGEWSDDGGRLLFAANRRHRGLFDAYVQTLGAEAEMIWENDSPGYPVGLTFSPGGGRAVCSRMESSFRHRLFEIDIEAKTARDISPSDEEARYSCHGYAEDGGSVYVTTDVGSDFLYVACIDFETLKLERLVESGWDVRGLCVSPDGRRLVYEVNVGGASELHALDLPSGETVRADLGDVPGVISSVGFGDSPSFSPDSKRLLFPFTNATSPTDVYEWDLEAETVRRVTRSSYGGIPGRSFSAPELVQYPTFDEGVDGRTRMIPAWIYVPEGVEGKVPVLTLVHGGPEGQSRPGFDFRVQYFLQNGYAVFVPNVRGSTGYGKAYSHLDDVRKRMDSVADLAEGARWLKGQPGIDGDRIVVYGGSYGGFMVLLSVTTYPELWVAGIDIVGISNLATFLENTSAYRRGHRAAEYGSLEEDREFLESIAPINHIDRIEAPLMVIQGANDPRVPLSESEQMVEALREQGKPVEFLVFDDEGHGVVRLKNRMVAYPAIIDFLRKHV